MASSISLMNDSRGLKIAGKFEQNKVHVHVNVIHVQILFKKIFIILPLKFSPLKKYFPWYSVE